MHIRIKVVQQSGDHQSEILQKFNYLMVQVSILHWDKKLQTSGVGVTRSQLEVTKMYGEIDVRYNALSLKNAAGRTYMQHSQMVDLQLFNGIILTD